MPFLLKVTNPPSVSDHAGRATLLISPVAVLKVTSINLDFSSVNSSGADACMSCLMLTSVTLSTAVFWAGACGILETVVLSVSV